MSNTPILQAKASAGGTGTAFRTVADVVGESAFQPRTDLGRKLWELRRRIVASGEPLLDEDQVEEEVDRRRGGVGL